MHLLITLSVFVLLFLSPVGILAQQCVLEESIAASVQLGPFLDSTNGDTEETALTISQADIRLSKNGADFAQPNDAGGAAHNENGFYTTNFNTTDTNTVGVLEVFVHESGALYVKKYCEVVSAEEYNSRYSNSYRRNVNVAQISTDSGAADNLELDYDGTGYSKANSTMGTVTTLTGHTVQTGDSYAIVNSGTYGNAQLVRATTPANTLDIDGSGEVTAENERGTDSALLAANVNVSAGVVESNLVEMGGVAQSATDLKDFADAGYNPATDKVQGVVLVDTTTTNTDVRGTDSAATAASLTTHDNKLAPVALDGGGATIGGMLTKMADDSGGAGFDATSDSLESIRNRGDAAWITGGGGGITDILNIIPVIPISVDLANTATVRLALRLVNSLDDLPTTAEITPGTVSIERKVIGGTSWSAVVTDAACSEIDGQVYYDEVFDTGAGYAEGDSLRITFKTQKITVAANDYEIFGATGAMFQSEVRQTMRGTNSAATASALSTHDGKLDTAQTDLDTLTGADGVTLATAQGNYAPAKAGDNMNLADDAITPPKYNDAASYTPYDGGVWVDSAATNANTVVGVDGLPSNPVSTLTAARTLANVIGVQKYYIVNTSSLTLAATHEDWVFVGIGRGNILSLGGQDVDNSCFFNLSMTGTQGGSNLIMMEGCQLTSLTALKLWATRCWLSGTNTIAAGSMFIFDQCLSAVAGAGTPILIFSAGVTTVQFRHYSGGLEVQSMTSDHTMSFETDGQLVVNANCTSGNISARGNMQITDNGTTMNITKVAVYNTQQIADSLKLAPTAGAPAAGSVNADIDTLLTRITAAVALESTLTAMKGAGWSTETLVTIEAAINGLNDVSNANVLTQVNAALDAANTELASVPNTTGSLRTMIQLLHTYFRNKKTMSTTTETVFKEDASTPLGAATYSRTGALVTKGELN